MKVFIIAAISADGFIARHKEEFADWTSKDDKRLFVELTKQAGVMVMGGTTFRTIGRALPGRRNIVYSRSPIDVEGIETTQESPGELIARLQKEGHDQVAICGGSTIYDMFMRANLVNELYLTVEPIVFGSGVPFFAKVLEARLELLDTMTFESQAVLLHYGVKR